MLATPLWLAALAWVGIWWFNPANIVNLPLFIILSAALLYENLVAPLAFIFFTARARYPAEPPPVKGSKVALITLCVPSQESLSLVERQLMAMKAVEYPHDSWVLDEGDTKAIKQLARKHGVKYFSRKGIKKYNQLSDPFMAKTKAGNVNAWLDFSKKYKYEYFVQLDIDHAPKPNYLDKVLGHFRDNSVGWVQSPSVNNNLSNWIARGSAEQELGLQGPMQMGFYGHNEAPIVTGSHCAFRTKAINEIGGFQATRAEDHLNTLAMLTKGYKGVYVPEVIAEGHGPETLEAYLTQQFAWARSITLVLLRHSRQFLKQLDWKRKLQFIFMETWYPLWSLTFMVLFFAPIFMLFSNTVPVATNLHDFWTHTPLLLFTTLVSAYWVGKPLMQPRHVRLTWRGALLHLIRWPAVLRGVVSAFIGGTKPYQVTPKGRFLSQLPRVKLYSPFLFLSMLSAAAIIFSAIVYGHFAASTQFIFAFFNVLTMLGICLLDINYRLRKKMQLRFKFGYWAKPVIAITAATLVVATAFITPFLPNQTAVAPNTVPSLKHEIRDITKIPPELLTNAELDKEIANSAYRIDPNQPTPSLGLYTKGSTYKTKQPYIRMNFVDWRQPRVLKLNLLTSERIGATPLITLDPLGEQNGQKLLDDITNGIYDSRLVTMFKIMAASPNLVYVRFAHEMDNDSTYYPWASQDPATFIAAYRHVIDLARLRHMDNLKWVWSPMGRVGAVEYYPGSDYVDVVGFTLLSDYRWFNGEKLGFSTISGWQQFIDLHRFNKPLWITEFGVVGDDPVYQQQFIADALQDYKRQGIDALIYINLRDPNQIGGDYRLKDFTILGDTFVPANPAAQTPYFMGSDEL